MDSEQILDEAACGLAQTTDTGVFRRVNKMFCDWLGYEKAELVGKRKLSDLLTIGAKMFHQTHWSPLLRMQGSVSEVKLQVIHKDGSTLPMILNAVRREQDGEVVHEIAAYIARDRDRYEQELLQSRARLELLVAEAKQHSLFAEQMIGIVSHDLRNPMSTISMATDLLAADPKAVDRLVPQIRRAIDRASRLVLDLLDFTQARVGPGLSIDRHEVDLHAAVAEIVEAQHLAYPKRKLVHVKTGTGRCFVDTTRLAQLIGNLVANAVAYGDPSTPIEVRSTIQPSTFTIAVWNAGPPIPPATLETIFQPMTRGRTETTKDRSIGLGLYIVQEIAKAHGGVASVQSTEAGTTFSVEFPGNP